MRKILFVLATLVLGLGSAGAVSAASGAPIRGTYDNGFETFLDQDVCAAAPWQFDVVATQHEYGFFEVRVDANGNFMSAIVHRNYDATISANGHTILERDTWTTFISAVSGAREVGLTVHIQGPGGIVVRDAGQIVSDADGDFEYLRGPHEQFSGVSFCPALA
jgi:hypothetical protein